MELWGETAWVRPSADSARQVRSGSDTEHFRAILTRAGYTAPPHLLAVRMVRLLDDPQGVGQGRRELMLIYAEDLAARRVTVDQVTTGGRPDVVHGAGGAADRACGSGIFGDGELKHSHRSRRD